MEDMNKKKRSAASSEAFPYSYVTRTFKKKHRLVDELFASVRNNVALATLVYSFLPMNDRVRLGEVDKQFYGDKDRGQIVGVYGDNYLNIQEALEKVREYLEYESMINSVREFSNNPYYWDWVFEVGDGRPNWVAEKLERSWFDEKLGYDLNAVQEHADFGEYQNQVMEGLASVNRHHRDNQKLLEKLSADVKNLGPLPPYDSLFDVMEKYNMAYFHFLYAESQPINGFTHYAYKIENGYLEHLRPARMLSFRDADGKMVQTVLKTCSKCNKVNVNVRTELCGYRDCVTPYSVCCDCATKPHRLSNNSLEVHTCSHVYCG
jgi:hypothetical protein